MQSKPQLRFWVSPEARLAGADFLPPRIGDAGFDLRSACNITIPAGGQVLVPTGLHCAIPLGWVGIVKDRSSMASKRLYTHAGVIDASYRGEIKLVLSNAGSADFQVTAGLKIAQMLVLPHLEQAEAATSLEALGDTDRGSSGFGSTGS
ncbi:MAG: dUTP diphosphatase [Oligoflexia bacterium]|nr:dUTP diphosphatase [Oligoflexia bacterium]